MQLNNQFSKMSTLANITAFFLLNYKRFNSLNKPIKSKKSFSLLNSNSKNKGSYKKICYFQNELNLED